MTYHYMHKIILFISGLCLTSCYSDIDLEEYRDNAIADMLVLNSIINPDSTVTVFASHPWFYTDYNLDVYGDADIHDKVNVPDLEIAIKVDGKEVDKMRYNDRRRCYTSSYKPQPGEIVEILAPYRGATVRAESQIPQPVAIEDILVIVDGPLANDTYKFTFRMRFRDKAGEDNYYFLDAPIDDASDYVFKQLGMDVTGFTIGWDPWTWRGLPFSDYGIDGDTYSLTFSCSFPAATVRHWVYSPDSSDSVYSFKLFAISPDYYKYIIGIMANDDDETLQGGLSSMGLAAPVAVESNVEGGLGILGSYTLTERLINLRDYVSEDRLVAAVKIKNF